MLRAAEVMLLTMSSYSLMSYPASRSRITASRLMAEAMPVVNWLRVFQVFWIWTKPGRLRT